jgi:HAD superfamily hydrolase (TIGR01509 family)
MEDGLKAVILDLDGTMIDSMKVWDRIGIEFLACRNIVAPENLGKVVKNMSMNQSAVYYKQQFGLEGMNEDQIITCWVDMVYKHYATDIPLKDGLLEYLSQLKRGGMKLAVATASDIKLVEAVLGRHKIFEIFDVVVTVKEIGKGKDCPDIFLACASKLGVKPVECIVIEDCLHAIKTSSELGMKTIAIFDESAFHEIDELKKSADKYIYSFLELLER